MSPVDFEAAAGRTGASASAFGATTISSGFAGKTCVSCGAAAVSFGGKTKIIYHEYLKDELHEQTLVQFSSDDRYVFFGGQGALIGVFLPQKKAFSVPFSGKIVSISEFGAKDIFFVLSKEADTYTVTLLSEGKYRQGSFSFKATNAFVHAENGDIYVGCDDRISKMHVSFD